MANRKRRAKRRAAEQRIARERRRDADRETAVRRQRTAAATAARQAAARARIERHDAAMVPLIRELREARATWSEIATWLDEAAISPPGRTRDTRGWSATAVWRIAKRAGLTGQLPREREAEEAPVALTGGRLKLADGRVVRPTGPRRGVVAHDELVLPTIRMLRGRGLSWRKIADHLEAQGVISPGQRDAHIRARGWTATGAWRIGRRHGVT
ncbi:MAG: hypothetical protein OXD40_05645 [bacterium]|nr:hypothetical protein [bacterium]